MTPGHPFRLEQLGLDCVWRNIMHLLPCRFLPPPFDPSEFSRSVLISVLSALSFDAAFCEWLGMWFGNEI